MKKFLIGLVTGLLLAGFTVLILAFAAMRFGERRPSVADGSTLVFKLEGDVPEQAPIEIPLPFLENQAPITMLDTWQILRRAAADSRIKAVVFEPRGLEVGWAKLEQIRDSLLAFRKSGKPLHAYLRNPGTAEYYLATAAERIYMAPEDMLDVKGLRAETIYLKGGLDKLGVKFEVEHAGKFKDAGDMFTRTSMTPETREVLTDIVDQFYGDLVNVISSSRKKDPAKVRALIDDGPFQGQDALSSGLVDALSFEDDLFNDLKARLKQSDIKKVSHRDYLKASSDGQGRRRIAVVTAEGEITRGSGQGGLGGDTGITSGGMTKVLKHVQDDASIRGVILRVDSPGGDGIASDDILHAVKELSKRKPVVISMSDLAASGGYFIAMSGDPIVAYPNTLTGSIGVIFARINLRGLYDKLGISKDGISRGRFADLDSEYLPLTDAEKAKIRQQVDGFYKAFVTRVAEGRRRKYGEIEPLAQGRVWLGAQARKNGLVDELGGLDRAIEMVKQRAQIAAGEGVTLVPYPQKRTLWDFLMSRSDNTEALETKLRTVLKVDLPLRSLRQGGFLKLMPYMISVR